MGSGEGKGNGVEVWERPEQEKGSKDMGGLVTDQVNSNDLTVYTRDRKIGDDAIYKVLRAMVHIYPKAVATIR